MTKPSIKKILSYTSQALVFVAIFYAITLWQQKDMLETGSQNLAPSFALVDMDGNLVKFDPKAQTKQTLIYFFAPWCPVCHASIDNIESIKKSTGNRVNFLIIALDWKNKQQVEEFLAQHELTIAVLLGTQSTLTQFQIGGFPSYYVISDTGRLTSKDMGYTTELGMRLRLGF
ncbi:MAG: redoxin family protein [Enterobacterales bacterium]|nr:redoxin family protein [Enterobacterales bacterium]